MKRIVLVSLAIASVFCLVPQATSADVWVDGYYRSDGTWVNGHYRSDPNGYFWDNYSSYGNINPYTGERGYKWPDYTSDRSSLYSNYYRSYDYDYDSDDYIWNNDWQSDSFGYSNYDECLDFKPAYECDEEFPAYKETWIWDSWFDWWSD